MNWAYYSHYVGDVFGAPLAIEGLMAFFLEATFIGLFFFGWDKLSKVGASRGHMAGGARLQSFRALDPDRQRLDAASGRRALQSRHDADGGHRLHGGDLQSRSRKPSSSTPCQRRLRHRLRFSFLRSAPFTCCAAEHIELAKRSMTVAASFGLAAALSVIVLGDESGYTVGENQKMKIAAIEAMWDTEPAPASFTIFGFPNQEAHRTDDALRAPWMLGLIATRSINRRSRRHQPARRPREGSASARASSLTTRSASCAPIVGDRGAKGAPGRARRRPRLRAASSRRSGPTCSGDRTPRSMQAAWSTVPPVSPLFWSFRLMVGLGFFLVGLFAVAFYLASARRLQSSRVFLHVALCALPLPWIAAELGWYVAEVGRQPWVIEGVLPTFLAVSKFGDQRADDARRLHRLLLSPAHRRTSI